MLEASELACVRGERTLFEHVSFALEPGTLLRVTGANGSGKTSLLRIACGLMLPASGEVRWAGRDIRTLREEYSKHLAYVGHPNALKDDLTPAENLRIGSALAGREISDSASREALAQVGVAAISDLPVRALSQGQRRRVALARLVLSRTAMLWVLDEPFTALDARAVAFVEALVGDQLRQGGSVILTTHQEARVPAPVEKRLDLDA